MLIISKWAYGEQSGRVAVGGKADFSLDPNELHIYKYGQRLLLLFYLTLIYHNFYEIGAIWSENRLLIFKVL